MSTCSACTYARAQSLTWPKKHNAKAYKNKRRAEAHNKNRKKIEARAVARVGAGNSNVGNAKKQTAL